MYGGTIRNAKRFAGGEAQQRAANEFDPDSCEVGIVETQPPSLMSAPASS
jgi:hypothetical protein